jgi:hypothetical protein
MKPQDNYNNDETRMFDDQEPVAEYAEQVDEKKDYQNLKRTVAVGVASVAAGAGGMALAQNLMGGSEESEKPVEEVVEDNDHAHGVTDDMSFSEAFNTARAEQGPGGIFHWHGQAYNTYTKEEWDSMSQEDRNAYAQRVKDDISDQERANYTAQHNSSHHSTEQTHSVSAHTATDGTATAQQVVSGDDDDANVVVLGVQEVTTEDGNIITVGAARIEDYDVVMVDTNHDGIFDVATVDANQNGKFDQDEYMSLQGQNVTVNQFQQMGSQHDTVARQEMGNVPNDDDGTVPETDVLANNDMPDYSQDYGMVDDTSFA